jgi:PGF-CTERM protein
MYFMTADDSSAIRFYPMVEYTVGGVSEKVVVETNATATVTETVENGNVTPVGNETPIGTPGEAVSTATTPAEVVPTDTAEPTATKKPVPGFEAIFAIAGLLAVAYLVLRQRD